VSWPVGVPCRQEAEGRRQLTMQKVHALRQEEIAWQDIANRDGRSVARLRALYTEFLKGEIAGQVSR